jgi:predicted esterase YcpF (UPF0227 family)
MILYLHGFRSSPASLKARLLTDYFAAHGRAAEFVCPQLPASPAQAINLLQRIIDQYGNQHAVQSDNQHSAQKLCLIGSSLGGFYATYLAEKNNCKAVLINPAVTPPRDLEKYVGVTTAYHSDEVFEFKSEYVEELRQFAISKISHPERYFLLAATGDEVLDWREMVSHYPSAKQHIIQGSDHGISEFADYLNLVVAFCDAA